MSKEIIDRMYGPLISGFEYVSSMEFLKEDFEEEGEVGDIMISELVATIPEALHERMRDDALKGMGTYQRLIKGTIRMTAKDYIDTPVGVKRPRKMSFNATCMESLKTNLADFLDRNCSVWDENEFVEYTELIEDANSKLFIEDPAAREKIAQYVQSFVSHAMARIPYVLDESNITFDTESDESDYETYWESKRSRSET
jgi:hypothetical protein